MKIVWLRVYKAVEKFSLTYLAHHDRDNPSFKIHVFKIGPLYLCVGCTCAALGLLTWVIIVSLLKLEFFIYAIIAAAGFIAAVLQLKFSATRIQKIVFRNMLGLGIGAYISIIVQTEQLLVQLILIALYILITMVYSSLRQNINSISRYQ